MTDGDRPQDVGRSHARKGAPSPETAELLATYQAAMRTELRACLAELEGQMEAPGLGVVEPSLKRPTMPDRMRLWDLAIKLGRELGSAIDADPLPSPTGQAAATRTTRRRRPEYE